MRVGRTGRPAAWISARGASELCRVVAAAARPLALPIAGDASRLDPGVAACLGVPLVRADGRAHGALCVVDRHPRTWRRGQIKTLRELADAIAVLLEPPATAGELAPRPELEQSLWALLSSSALDLQQPLTIIRSQAQDSSDGPRRAAALCSPTPSWPASPLCSRRRTG